MAYKIYKQFILTVFLGLFSVSSWAVLIDDFSVSQNIIDYAFPFDGFSGTLLSPPAGSLHQGTQTSSSSTIIGAANGNGQRDMYAKVIQNTNPSNLTSQVLGSLNKWTISNNDGVQSSNKLVWDGTASNTPANTTEFDSNSFIDFSGLSSSDLLTGTGGTVATAGMLLKVFTQDLTGMSITLTIYQQGSSSDYIFANLANIPALDFGTASILQLAFNGFTLVQGGVTQGSPVDADFEAIVTDVGAIVLEIAGPVALDASLGLLESDILIQLPEPSVLLLFLFGLSPLITFARYKLLYAVPMIIRNSNMMLVAV